jgi:hypothetical protein
MGCSNSSTAKAVEAPLNVATGSLPIAQEKVGALVHQMPVEGDDCSTAMATEASAPPSQDATDDALREVETAGTEAKDLETNMPKAVSAERSRSGWTVQEAFDHHMKCVFDQDMDALMLDFNEATHFRLHEYHVDNDGQELHILSYPDEIREFYEGLFTAAAEGTLKSEMNGGEDTMRYFSWEAPTLGYLKCFDTVVFEMTPGGPMIKQQNVAVTKGKP